MISGVRASSSTNLSASRVDILVLRVRETLYYTPIVARQVRQKSGRVRAAADAAHRDRPMPLAIGYV
jgi:hypothetical protein